MRACSAVLLTLLVPLTQVSCMPWSDSELAEETYLLQEKLAELNRKGVLTINSQVRPRRGLSFLLTDPSVEDPRQFDTACSCVAKIQSAS